MKDIFSCDDVYVMVMFQMDSVKYNFVEPFSPHVESVNDKKREALVVGHLNNRNTLDL